MIHLPRAALAAIAALAAVAATPVPTLAQHGQPMAKSEFRIGAMVIAQPWTRATPKGAPVAGGYVTITNTGTTPDRLIGGSFDLAGRFEIHEMSVSGGMMKMRHLPKGLDIGAGKTIELKPGSFHLMFFGLKGSPQAGHPVKGTLVFDKAGKIDIEFAVAPLGAKSAPAGEHDHSKHQHHGSAAPAAAAGMAHDGADHHTHGSQFTDAARWARTFDDPKRDAWQKPREVLTALNIKSGNVIADIGAGTGYLAVRLAHHAGTGKVYASDVSKSMVEFLQKRAKDNSISNLHAVQGSETSANLPEPVDLAVLLDVYHHIGKRVDYFRALQKSLKPGGRIAIIDFRPESKFGSPKHMRIPVSDVDAEMKAAGYARTASHGFLPRQYFLIYQVAK